MGKFKKSALAVCIAEMIIAAGSLTACGAGSGSNVPQQETAAASEVGQESVPQNEPHQETVQTSEMQQETTMPSEAQSLISETPQAAVQANAAQQPKVQQNAAQQDINQPASNGTEQISLETAKNAALTDAGVSAADVIYTKEKLDYEDGIAVYEIEFYAGDAEYEYEINATTGAVYSKSVETHHNQNGHGYQGSAGTAGTDIGIESAKSIALGHAGFAEADVSHLRTEFDIDDGVSVYEIEFDKDGREYEYKINAADGSVIEYDVD